MFDLTGIDKYEKLYKNLLRLAIKSYLSIILCDLLIPIYHLLFLFINTFFTNSRYVGSRGCG